MSKVSRKPLFDVQSKEFREPKERRRRKKKEDSGERRSRRKKVETVDTPITSDEWKDYRTTKPDVGVPVEFKVITDKGKELIFHGFRKAAFETCIDEPYYFAVLSKKFDNLWYRLIGGCNDAWNCPDNFPLCDRCPKHK